MENFVFGTVFNGFPWRILQTIPWNAIKNTDLILSFFGAFEEHETTLLTSSLKNPVHGKSWKDFIGRIPGCIISTAILIALIISDRHSFWWPRQKLLSRSCHDSAPGNKSIATKNRRQHGENPPLHVASGTSSQILAASRQSILLEMWWVFRVFPHRGLQGLSCQLWLIKSVFRVLAFGCLFEELQLPPSFLPCYSGSPTKTDCFSANAGCFGTSSDLSRNSLKTCWVASCISLSCGCNATGNSTSCNVTGGNTVSREGEQTLRKYAKIRARNNARKLWDMFFVQLGLAFFSSWRKASIWVTSTQMESKVQILLASYRQRKQRSDSWQVQSVV